MEVGGLTLPAMGLWQVAQMLAGAAVMPSSCRSRVRLPSMLSSEGLGSPGTPSPCPTATSCQEGGWRGPDEGWVRARPPTSLPPGPRLTLLCMWPRSARSSSSCRAAAVGGSEGINGCGTGMGLLGTAESEGCCGFSPKARGCPGLRTFPSTRRCPFSPP